MGEIPKLNQRQKDHNRWHGTVCAVIVWKFGKLNPNKPILLEEASSSKNDPNFYTWCFPSVLAFYVHLRRSQSRHAGSRGDIQELTTHAHLNGDVETMANGFATEDAAPVKVSAILSYRQCRPKPKNWFWINLSIKKINVIVRIWARKISPSTKSQS